MTAKRNFGTRQWGRRGAENYLGKSDRNAAWRFLGAYLNSPRAFTTFSKKKKIREPRTVCPRSKYFGREPPTDCPVFIYPCEWVPGWANPMGKAQRTVAMEARAEVKYRVK